MCQKRASIHTVGKLHQSPQSSSYSWEGAWALIPYKDGILPEHPSPKPKKKNQCGTTTRSMWYDDVTRATPLARLPGHPSPKPKKSQWGTTTRLKSQCGTTTSPARRRWRDCRSIPLRNTRKVNVVRRQGWKVNVVWRRHPHDAAGETAGASLSETQEKSMW